MEFERYDKEVLMWVYEEMIDGKKLSEIINEKHENVKYLPGTILPDNIVRIFIFLIYMYFLPPRGGFCVL